MSSISVGGGAGVQGKSAYQVWIDQGNVGTEADFLTAISAGDSAYQIWLGLGNAGTEQDFIDSLSGNGTPVSVVSAFPGSPTAGTLYIKV